VTERCQRLDKVVLIRRDSQTCARIKYNGCSQLEGFFRSKGEHPVIGDQHLSGLVCRHMRKVRIHIFLSCVSIFFSCGICTRCVKVCFCRLITAVDNGVSTVQRVQIERVLPRLINWQIIPTVGELLVFLDFKWQLLVRIKKFVKMTINFLLLLVFV
jgi:hypothetical protein